MEVPAHKSQHERAEELPLVTDAAEVVRVDPMDEDRREEVRDALGDLFHLHGRDEWAKEIHLDGEEIDWNRLDELVEREHLREEIGTRVAKLGGRYRRNYPSLVRIRFDPGGSFDFVPGEYLTVHFHDVPRPYSIASSPNEEDVEICVRRVAGGRLSSQLCTDLEPGDTLSIRGPFGGEFVLQEASARDMVFLATGTGVAPFKSMIDYAFEEGYDRIDGTDRDVWLFLGASWKDDLPYHEEFTDLAGEHDNFHYVPTASREGYLTDWTGETDYVQQTLLKHLVSGAGGGAALDPGLARYLDEDPVSGVDARIDPAAAEVYACGINAMVYSLVDIVEAIGVPERYIRVEGYG